MTQPTIARIASFTLNVRDLDRAIDFYMRALSFGLQTRTDTSAILTLGAERLELVERPYAAAYPSPRAANDPWFQHFAIAVADMDAAYAQLAGLSPEPITRGGPQLLPPSTGSVTAFKFRDPDGHPLELSYVPSSRGRTGASASNAVFLGIDHSALAVGDLEASIQFYTDLGFHIGDRLLNRGPEQSRLDGLEEACLDIVTMLTPEAGPHLELLHYRDPPPPPARTIGSDDIAATHTIMVMTSGSKLDTASRHSDPDGHWLNLVT